MCSILVVDDEAVVLKMLEHALGRYGYVVDTAASGAAAIEKFNSKHFDMVITDVCMPGIGGLELLAHIRASNRHQTPTVGISGTPWKLENAGFDRTLPKPFGLKLLFDTLDQLRVRPVNRAATA